MVDLVVTVSISRLHLVFSVSNHTLSTGPSFVSQRRSLFATIMQFILFSVFALLFSAASGFSLAARQQGAPSCALDCLATTPTGSCSNTNDTCLCHEESFLEAQFACVKKACTSPSDFAAAQQFALALCEEVGVDLSTDTNLIPAATSGGSNSTAAPAPTSPAPASPAPQTSGATSLDVRAVVGLLLSVAGIAFTL